MSMPSSSVVFDAPVESSSSAVSWAAIIAGAFVATAVTLILLLVGAGLGLTLVSPWSSQSATAATISIYAIIWLVIVQWFSAGIGGYLTGRLRTKWSGLHTDEVYFRDTAHGFLSWAAATLVIVMLLGSTVSAIVSAGTQATVAVAGATAAAATSAATAAASNGPDFSTAYFTDSLLRPADPRTPAATGSNEAAAAEISRILMNGAVAGEISADDRTYVERLIAARTGLTEAEAKARVDAVVKQVADAKAAAQAAAETARKTASATALLSALSLFIGAFIASVAGALGGRRRDENDQLVLV